MRESTPYSLRSPATGSNFRRSSAIVVAASESRVSGETVVVSPVITSRTVTPALFKTSC